VGKGGSKLIEEARKVLGEIGWQRANAKGKHTLKFDDEEDYESGLFVPGDLTIRYVHPTNDLRRASITKRHVRFFTVMGGVIIEDRVVDIEDLERIEELARIGTEEGTDRPATP
jgi:hypothetical protein